MDPQLIIVALLIIATISITTNVIYYKPMIQIEEWKKRFEETKKELARAEQYKEDSEKREKEIQNNLLNICRGLRFKRLIGSGKHYDEEWVPYPELTQNTSDTFHSEPFSIGDIEWIVKVYHQNHHYGHSAGRRFVELNKCVIAPKPPQPSKTQE